MIAPAVIVKVASALSSMLGLFGFVDWLSADQDRKVCRDQDRESDD